MVHVCSAHDDDDSRVFHRACVSLAEAGYDVHLIASSAKREPYQRKGVSVHPIPLAKNRRERFARRTRVAAYAASLAPDLFHVHEPELLGPVLKRAGARPVVWDVHESYLDVLMAREWIPAPVRPLLRMAWDLRERALLRKCASVVAATDPIATRYRKFHSRVLVVANYPHLRNGGRSRPEPPTEPTCVFAGSLGPDRGLFQILDALAILRKRGSVVHLALAGRPVSSEFLPSLLAHAHERGVEDLVRYDGVLSKDQVATFHVSGTLGVVTYLPTGNSIAGLPTKLLECMSFGLPVVFSHFPVYLEVAGDSGAGIGVDPLDAEAIAEAIGRLVSEPELARAMGERGLQAVRERFNWEVEWPKLRELYRQLLR